MDALIRIIELCKTYHPNRPDAFEALRDVTLTIDRQDVVALQGPSGSGKTTLLGLLGGMARPTSGRILLAGREISRLPERFLTRVRRRTFGFVFQQFHLIKNLSVLDNVLLPLYPENIGFGAMRRRGLEVLDQFGLGDKAGRRVEQLSGGEQQRVAISRALINDPEVLIADEPTAHLDRQLAEEFLAILERLNREGRTVVIATHDPLVSEHRFVKKRVSMRDGAVTGVEER